MDRYELNRLKAQVKELRVKLDRIDGRLNESEGKESAKRTEASTNSTPTPGPVVDMAQNWELERTDPKHQPMGTGKVLGIVAVLCFVLAASFLVKLAIDSGWLTPARQIGLSGLLGASLIVAGLRFLKRDIEYLSLLPAAGIVILHLTAYGGKLYADLYNDWMAAFLVSSVSILSLLLYRYLKNDFYALVAVVGTYICPILLPSIKGSELNVMMFFSVWDVAFVTLAILMQQRTMLLLAAYMALGIFLFTSNATWNANATDSALLHCTLFQLFQFIAFAVGAAMISIRHRISMTATETWAYFPLLLFFYGIEYSLINRLSPDLAPWIALGFGAFIYGVYHLSKKFLQKQSLESGSMVFSFLALVLFHALYLEILPNRLAPWSALALTAFVPFIVQKADLQRRHLLVGLVIFAILGIEYGRVLIGLSKGVTLGEWIALGSLFFGLLFTGYLLRSAKYLESVSSWWLGILALANIQALMALYRLAEQFSEQLKIDSMKGFVVSIFWGLFALAILFCGKVKRDRLLARSSLFIFGVAAAKVLLIDVASASAVVRILCLLSLGVAFYIGGYLFRQIDRWTSTTETT